jgi:hypothetical protein
MQIVYDGPLDGVVISETGQVAMPGEQVEVEAALAERLLEQDVWKKKAQRRSASVRTPGSAADGQED